MGFNQTYIGRLRVVDIDLSWSDRPMGTNGHVCPMGANGHVCLIRKYVIGNVYLNSFHGLASLKIRRRSQKSNKTRVYSQ